jgi:endonuclease/exonuclease/phosphatase family metal-dependent hydrolase
MPMLEEGDMQLRVITWNVRGGDEVGLWLELLSRCVAEAPGAAVVCLQEVRRRGWEQLMEAKWLDQAHWSLDHRPPGPYDGENRKLGCVIAAARGLRLGELGVVERAPFPDRTLWARGDVAGAPLEVLCMHALTGVGYRRGKSAQFRSIAEWLGERRGAGVPRLFCGDMNEPKQDAHELKDVAFANPGKRGSIQDHASIGAGRLLGTAADHGLKDCFRTWLAEHPDAAAAIRTERPDGPLEVTYVRGTKVKTPCRYDVVYASKEWRVDRVVHLYREAIDAKSDHGLVMADVQTE